MGTIDQIAQSMVADANLRIREHRARLAELPLGLKVVDWDFYTAADGPARDRDAQMPDMRCCVVIARWDGERFARVKRLSGCLAYENVHKMVRARAKGLSLPSADDVRAWADGRESQFTLQTAN